MTKKLYYDHNIKECDALVLACRKGEDGFEVRLDQTVIYPEGGGQPSDRGFIDGAAVPYAFEEGEDIWHCCEKAFEEGARVHVRFDEAVRFDHSQQHTGEHMLSGLASSMFGCANVGFHMAEDYVSVDFDKPLSDEEVDALELAANEAIQRNEPTDYKIVDAQELEQMTLRKRAAGLSGEIRIVYTGGVDSCTCCGTHTASAGEVGVLKITAHANHRGGTRMFFLCGMRAVRSMIKDREHLDVIARRFSTKPEEAVQMVVKQGDELAETRRLLKQRTGELFAYRATALYQNAAKAGDVAIVVSLEKGLNMPELGMLCEQLLACGKAVAVMLSEMDGALLYRMARSNGVDLSMKEVCLAVNAATGGKGGGRDDAAQGSAPERKDANEICAQLETYLKNRLNAAKSSKKT